MLLVDTHTHLYLNAFGRDRPETIQSAIGQGVKYMLLPNIDSTSVDPMLALCNSFPENCYPMMGLHPTSVKENWRDELDNIHQRLLQGNYIAVGEVGLDFYWELTYRKEQEDVFRWQVELAVKHNLPLVIHSRKSMDEIIEIIKEMKTPALTGVFHCFSGSAEQGRQITALGFKLGIGGVITYKNAKLGAIIREIGIEHIVLETDAPFITPVPYRGKRNESAYIPIIAAHVGAAFGISTEEVAAVTSATARQLFRKLPQIN